MTDAIQYLKLGSLWMIAAFYFEGIVSFVSFLFAVMFLTLSIRYKEVRK